MSDLKVPSYRTIVGEGEGEIEEKKSRFIAHIRPVKTPEEAMEFVTAMKKKYWDARHNCYAYILGADMGIKNCSDDGEPSQTAGRPMLEILEKQGLTDIVVVVTRYFGGTLLGTGGLVRAYQGAVQEGLFKSHLVTMENGLIYRAECTYTYVGAILRFAEAGGLHVLSTEYAENVVFSLWVPLADTAKTCEALVSLTDGSIVLSEGGSLYMEKL